MATSHDLDDNVKSALRVLFDLGLVKQKHLTSRSSAYEISDDGQEQLARWTRASMAV